MGTDQKTRSTVTCLIPSCTGSEHVLGTLFSVINQDAPVLKVVIADNSEKGLDSTFAVKRFCRLARIDVVRLPTSATAHLARKELAKRRGPSEFVWYVDDDAWPAYDCLSNLLETAEEYKAKAVVGLKREVTRRTVWGGKDWNQAGDSIRLQQVNWCDTANVLISSSILDESLARADVYCEGDKAVTGEDILSTAKLAADHLCISQPKAVAYHIPLTEERWKDVDGSDDFVLDALEKELPTEALEWMKRSLDQSDW